jgi:hypothetical protein
LALLNFKGHVFQTVGPTSYRCARRISVLESPHKFEFVASGLYSAVSKQVVLEEFVHSPACIPKEATKALGKIGQFNERVAKTGVSSQERKT